MEGGQVVGVGENGGPLMRVGAESFDHILGRGSALFHQSS